MSDPNDLIKQALSALVAKHEASVRATFANAESHTAGAVAMLAPVLASMKAANDSIGTVPGVEIAVPEAGHIGFVRLTSSTGFKSLQVGTTSDNIEFQVDETTYYSFADEGEQKKRHRLESADEVVALVLDRLAAHVALHNVVREKHPG